MEVKINGDDDLNYKKIAMNADHRLDTDTLRFPLAFSSFRSGFFLLLNGASGSGKSNLLVNMLRSPNNKKLGLRKSFKKIFDNVFVVSPSLKTLKDNVFDNLKHRFETWDDETMDALDEVLDKNDELDDDDIEKTLLILDDCGSSLKGETERRFNALVKNRRHKHLSIICVTQKFKDSTTTMRANFSHFITFKPRNSLEMQSIYDEMIGQERKYMHDIMNGVFKKKYDHLLIDFTQSRGDKSGFQFYSNFRPIDFVKKII